MRGVDFFLHVGTTMEVTANYELARPLGFKQYVAISSLLY